MKTIEGDLISFINELCDISEKNILKYYENTVDVVLKADLSPVTVADQTTEEILRNTISKKFPDHAILGEEFGESGNLSSNYKWILDPIDGTKSFINKIPLFGTLIALLKDGKPYMGCINIPCSRERMIGQIGQKTTLNSKVVSVKNAHNLKESVMLTTCVKDSQAILGNNFNKLASKMKYVRTWGDCYGHFMVASGRSELMVDPILSLWDIAALKPCVEGAGGAFFDFSGSSSGLGTQAISCSPELKEEVLTILNQKES